MIKFGRRLLAPILNFFRKVSKASEPLAPLDEHEFKKRRREKIAIVVISSIMVILSILEYQLTRSSHRLPFANSVFFFGILNINVVLLIGLLWLIFRNIGKIFIERRRKLLGSRLKSKLVFAFLGFAIIPTIILFIVSSLYINSSFDKWFSIKIQNTLKASLDITRTYYKNADERGLHFGKHIATQLGEKISNQTQDPKTLLTHPKSREWVQEYLKSQRELLALNAVEFYIDPFDERMISTDQESEKIPLFFPRLALDLLTNAFSGTENSVIHHVGTGDLIRSFVPVYANSKLIGVLAVNTYIPVSLVTKVDEIATVFDDYRGTNPLVYPIKTQYFVLLVMITLVIIAVAIWIGLYIARELTVPMERLSQGAKQVGSGNLNVAIEVSGDDEITFLVKSFNSMISDLRVNREDLDKATNDLERRRLQLEAVLANIGTGVLVVDREGAITTFNRSATQLLLVKESETVLKRKYQEVLTGESEPLSDLIERAFLSSSGSSSEQSAEVTQWNFHDGGKVKSLAGIATVLKENEMNWGGCGRD